MSSLSPKTALMSLEKWESASFPNFIFPGVRYCMRPAEFL